MPEQSNGVLVGLVVDLADPEGLGRVRVRYPNLDDQVSTWARMVSPMAGGSRGVRLIPEVGDEVLVAFEHGEPRRPYVLGAMWSTTDPPPADDGSPEKNNWRTVVSRSGHVVKLDDTSGAEKVEITDSSGGLHVVLDSATSKVEIRADSGAIEVSAPEGAVNVRAQTVDVTATGAMTLASDATLTLRGATVQINP